MCRYGNTQPALVSKWVRCDADENITVVCLSTDFPSFDPQAHLERKNALKKLVIKLWTSYSYLASSPQMHAMLLLKKASRNKTKTN